MVELLAAVVTAIPASEPRRKTPFWTAEAGRVAGWDDVALLITDVIDKRHAGPRLTAFRFAFSVFIHTGSLVTCTSDLQGTVGPNNGCDPNLGPPYPAPKVHTACLLAVVHSH